MGWTHMFDEEYAVRHGLHEAIVYEHLRQWIRYNAANGINEHDGRTWTYNSVKAWQDQLPFMTEKQIRTALDSLRDKGEILVSNHGARALDRTLWYAVKDELPICPTGQMPFAPEGKSTIATSYKNNSPNIEPSAPSLFRAIQSAFEAKHGAFSDYGKEGKAIKGLIAKAQKAFPSDPAGFIRQLMTAFWTLKAGGDSFWSSQPFTPSALNASGIYDRVCEKLRTAAPVDAEMAEAIEGVFS